MKVPGSVRSHIIGRQGSTIQSISQDTGAKVQLPKVAQPALGTGDDEEEIDVLIEGDALGVSLAKARIQSIVSERTSNSTQRLKNVPREFFPFIAGAHNNRSAGLEDGKDLRVHVPHYHTWTEQPPPLPTSSTDLPAFVPSSGPSIQLTGDRVAVLQARAEIEQQVEELRRLLTTSQLEIERGRHQFVVGERGISTFDFLAETGCAVVLPPVSEDTEILTVIGPQESIETGINKVMELAMSMQMTNVDIARQHPKAPKGSAAHARHLTRYMQQRREIERLEHLYEAHIAVPSHDDSTSAWEIYSRDGRNTMRARQEVINLVNGLPPARLAHVDIEPFYHEKIRKQAQKHLKQNLGVHILFPEEFQESPEVILVYEGRPTNGADYDLPKKAPTTAEVKEFQDALQAAQQYMLSLASDHQEISSKQMDIPRR